MSNDHEAARFARDTAHHEMTVLHDDGVYRHLRFARRHSSLYWFEVVTWPGSLAFRGDADAGYVFSRQDDMFQFFRRNGNTDNINPDYWAINPDYWAEKLPGGRKSVQGYSETLALEYVQPHIAEYERAYPGRLAAYLEAVAEYEATPLEDRYPHGARRQMPTPPLEPGEIREIVEDADLSHEAGARALYDELERLGVASDTFEWDPRDWHWQYLWACQAIVWAIGQYDAAKKTADPEPRFVIRGKDILAPETIWAYRQLCRDHGLFDQASEVTRAHAEINEWQRRHRDDVKDPDHQHVPASQRS